MYELNHEMMNYDFIEGIEFEGLMPKAIDKIGGVGHSDENVSFFGFEARGMDSLEVVDVEKVFGEGGSEEGGEGGESGESGNEGGEGGNEGGSEGGNEGGETPADGGDENIGG